MMKYVVCGTSVEDVEAGVEAMKMAVASGKACGVGGSTIAEVEQAMAQLRQMAGHYCYSQMDSDYCPCCEDEDEDEEIGYSEGYMALDENGERLSGLWGYPEDAMSDAIGNGYYLDEIGVYSVRIYDDDSIEVIDTIHRPAR